MNLPARHRKIILCSAILLMVAVEFGLNPNIANAQSAVSSFLGNAAGSFVKSAQGAAGMGIAYAFLFVAYTGLIAAISITGFFLDNLASFNLTWNITSQPLGLVANQGWTVMRDLSNGLFILIVLWIAITIIFNIEHLGGKKLLIRVIVVALLINFSFAMVSAVFGFANVLAKPFYDPLKVTRTNGISGIIVGNSYIYEVAKQISTDDVKKLEEQLKNQQVNAQETGQNESVFASLWHSFGAPQEAHAQLTQVVLWIGANIAGALAGALVTLATAYVLLPLILNLIIADAFLAAMAVAFATISVILGLRLIAMVLLAVFAPVAFLGLMTPKYGERFWNEWLSYLFNWAFIAPVFFFLLYISLFMLTSLSQVTQNQNTAFNGNIFKMFNLTVFLILLFTAIRITRKMGGAIAETALTFGKQFAGFGLGVVTGGVAGIAAAGARRTGGRRLEKFMRETPILRSTILARRYGAYVEGQKARLAPHEAELKDASPERLAQEYAAAFRAERKASIGKLLAQKGEFHRLTKEQQESALASAMQFGQGSAMELFKARPDLATKERLAKIGITKHNNVDISTDAQAMAAVASKIGTSEAPNISNEIFAKNPTTGAYEHEESIQAMWREFRPEHLQQIARNKPATASTMMEYLNANPEMIKQIKPEMYTYLSSNASQGIGLRLPATHEKPQAIVEQDIRAIAAEVIAEQVKYTEQENRADRFKTGGNTQDETRARVDMQVIKDKIDVLNNKIDAMEEELRDNGVKVLSLQKNPLSVATEDRLYAGDVLPAGGTGPYQIEILEGGPLPRGLEFNGPTGRIVGTPTAAAVGRHRLVIRIRDSAGAQSVPRPIVLEIKPK